MNNEIDYSIMDETVDKICESLLSEPEGWSFGIWYIKAPSSLGSIEIEIGLQNTFTYCKHEGATTCQVFSLKQGKKIAEAYYKALSNIGSGKQQEILKKISTSREESNIIDTENILDTKEKSCTISGILFLIAIFLLAFKQ